MVCPNCGAQQLDGAVECSSCGVIFAKWGHQNSALQAGRDQAKVFFPPKSTILFFILFGVGGCAFFAFMGRESARQHNFSGHPVLGPVLFGGFFLLFALIAASCARLLFSPRPTLRLDSFGVTLYMLFSGEDRFISWEEIIGADRGIGGGGKTASMGVRLRLDDGRREEIKMTWLPVGSEELLAEIQKFRAAFEQQNKRNPLDRSL